MIFWLLLALMLVLVIACSMFAFARRWLRAVIAGALAAEVYLLMAWFGVASS